MTLQKEGILVPIFFRSTSSWVPSRPFTNPLCWHISLRVRHQMRAVAVSRPGTGSRNRFRVAKREPTGAGRLQMGIVRSEDHLDVASSRLGMADVPTTSSKRTIESHAHECRDPWPAAGFCPPPRQHVERRRRHGSLDRLAAVDAVSLPLGPLRASPGPHLNR